MANKHAILVTSDVYRDAAKKLATHLHIPIVKTVPTEPTFIIRVCDAGLSLAHTHISPKMAIQVDFTKGKTKHRRLHGGGYGQAIAKAIGIKQKHKPSVLDATAGLGQDAFVIASLGCQITLIERSPIVAALLQDALNRAALDANISDIVDRIHLIEDDSVNYMRKTGNKPDVVYLDPMFPDNKKAALPKKEMQLLRMMIEDKNNDIELLSIALKTAKHRVVIKRPRLAKPFANKKPNLSFEGKSSRFDVYFIL